MKHTGILRITLVAWNLQWNDETRSTIAKLLKVSTTPVKSPGPTKTKMLLALVVFFPTARTANTWEDDRTT